MNSRNPLRAPFQSVRQRSDQSLPGDSLDSGDYTARESHSVLDQLSHGEVNAKTDVLREELGRHRQEFVRRRIESAQKALSVEVFSLNQTQILQNARRAADLRYLHQFLHKLCLIYEGCSRDSGAEITSQVLKEMWLNGIEPRWNLCVRSLGAGLKRLYHDEKAEVVAERVKTLETEAARIRDRELGLWRVKIEEAASRETLGRGRLVQGEPNKNAVSQAQSLESPPKRVKKQDLSHYFDAACLTPMQRECASLHWEHDVKVGVIARQLHKHHSTIQYHLSRAKQKMARKIKAKGRVAALPTPE